MSAGTATVLEGPLVRVEIVADEGRGTLVRCPAPHPRPTAARQRCGEPLTRIEIAGLQTIRCERCKHFIRIQAYG